MDFGEWINKIWSTIIDVVEFLFSLPAFLLDFLTIFPTEIQVLIVGAVGTLSILLIYRFVK